jgi:hypothetical protein
MSDAPVFTARRALWATLVNMLMGLLLAAITILNIVQRLREGGTLLSSVFFALLALFFLWHAWNQLRDRAPLIEVGPAGLRLPSASPDTLPWPLIRQVAPSRRLFGLRSSRIDFTVDPDTFARLKLGQRFMGDIIVKRPGMMNTFSVITPQLEENANAIYDAVTRYWRPARADDE